ncbi:MAG: hypothetical protein K8S56_10170 [Candidatus Cloacimonetes bacterium]|nr:hypothetical protein [Candidatus Cloacimonadota bacterium]
MQWRPTKDFQEKLHLLQASLVKVEQFCNGLFKYRETLTRPETEPELVPLIDALTTQRDSFIQMLRQAGSHLHQLSEITNSLRTLSSDITQKTDDSKAENLSWQNSITGTAQASSSNFENALLAKIEQLSNTLKTTISEEVYNQAKASLSHATGKLSSAILNQTEAISTAYIKAENDFDTSNQMRILAITIALEAGRSGNERLEAAAIEMKQQLMRHIEHAGNARISLEKAARSENLVTQQLDELSRQADRLEVETSSKLREELLVQVAEIGELVSGLNQNSGGVVDNQQMFNDNKQFVETLNKVTFRLNDLIDKQQKELNALQQLLHYTD